MGYKGEGGEYDGGDCEGFAFREWDCFLGGGGGGGGTLKGEYKGYFKGGSTSHKLFEKGSMEGSTKCCTRGP